MRRGYRSGGINTPAYNTPCVTGAPSLYSQGQTGASIPNGTGVCNDFGLASTNGAVASGKAIDLSAFQTEQPETLTDAEVGMRSDWNLGGWHERLNLTYFRYWYDNVIAEVSWGGESTPNGIFGFPLGTLPALSGSGGDPTFGAGAANVGSIVANGVDADIAFASPERTLSVDFNVSYLNQTATEKVPAALAAQVPAGYSLNIAQAAIQQFTSPTAPWSYTITARYILPWRPLNGQLELNYDYFWTGSFHAQSIALPGYDLHNMRLDWNNIGNTNISAGLWVRNLADNNYILVVGSGSGLDAFQYGEPRTFGFDMTVKVH